MGYWAPYVVIHLPATIICTNREKTISILWRKLSTDKSDFSVTILVTLRLTMIQNVHN